MDCPGHESFEPHGQTIQPSQVPHIVLNTWPLPFGEAKRTKSTWYRVLSTRQVLVYKSRPSNATISYVNFPQRIGQCKPLS
jgi:hypothetical protein